MVFTGQAWLHVPADPHLLGAADEHRDVPVDALLTQDDDVAGAANFMHEPDPVGPYSPSDELIFDRGVDGELGGIFGCTVVAERDLEATRLGHGFAGVGVRVPAIGVLAADTHHVIGHGHGHRSRHGHRSGRQPASRGSNDTLRPTLRMFSRRGFLASM
jgi:hypothetical protein